MKLSVTATEALPATAQAARCAAFAEVLPERLQIVGATVSTSSRFATAVHMLACIAIRGEGAAVPSDRIA